jgi:hypothetical protein
MKNYSTLFFLKSWFFNYDPTDIKNRPSLLYIHDKVWFFNYDPTDIKNRPSLLYIKDKASGVKIKQKAFVVF